MKNKFAYFYGFIILSILLGGIYVAKEAEIWQVSGKLNPDGSKIVIKGEDVTEIKGWSTLEDVINAFGLDKEEVYKDFNLSNDISPSTQLKDLAELTDEALSPSVMKEYISNKFGLEYDETSSKKEE